MIVSIPQGSGKRDRSPSPEPPSLEQEWVEDGEELKAQDSVEGPSDESASEQSGQEDIQLVSASQSQRLLILTLTEMVRSAFKLPLAEVTEPHWSSLGSLRPLQNLTCPVDNAQGLKDPVDKKLESLLKVSFSLASKAIQPAVAAIGICQSIKDQVKRPDRPNQEDDLPESKKVISRAMCFAIDALTDSIQQVSRLALAHMRRLLWLKNWSAELLCKQFPFSWGTFIWQSFGQIYP
ncbi:hypothetical protein AB205_0009020, partial [Aquarana catesbeiana]